MKNVNSWLEIYRDFFIHNIQEYRKITSSQIMAIVKSNAYGHDMVQTALAVQDHVDWFGVVNIDEAIQLHQQGITRPIFILSFFFEDSKKIAYCIENNIHFPLYKVEDANLLNEIGKKINKKALVHIKIDTGASRLGVLTDQAISFVQEIKAMPFINIQGIFSHFAASDENQDYTDKQIQKFNNILHKIKELGIEIPYTHFACSAASLVKPESQLSIIRLGISLYGLWPSQEAKAIAMKQWPDITLKPCLSWKTRIIQIKSIPKGTPVGYGCSVVVERDTTLAVLPVGYWDGYDRKLSNCGQVLINGTRCNILGRICMNLCMVDVTHLFGVDYNQEVVLIGNQGNECITAEEMAKKIGTINYEIVTRINPLIPRIFSN